MPLWTGFAGIQRLTLPQNHWNTIKANIPKTTGATDDNRKKLQVRERPDGNALLIEGEFDVVVWTTTAFVTGLAQIIGIDESLVSAVQATANFAVRPSAITTFRSANINRFRTVLFGRLSDDSADICTWIESLAEVREYLRRNNAEWDL